LQNGNTAESPCIVAFKKFETINKLTREVLVELIDHIMVHENGNISVKFTFADELHRVMEYIEINAPSEAV
jgi:hypothetical protein